MSSSLFRNSPTQSNPVSQQGQTNSMVGQINQMYKMVKNSTNPGQMFQQLAQSNPQVRAAYSQIMANGGDPKTVFYSAAKAKGLTDEQIQNGLNELQQMFQ